MEKEVLGIYIHIPFCKDKCYYCDFVSFKNAESSENSYIETLLKEIEDQDWDDINKKYKVTTIYIGGGTPSYISSDFIIKVLNVLKNKIKNPELNNIEVTIEVNPGTVDKQKLIAYKNSGINRLSIGLQSANNTLLKQIGRIHTFEQFLDTYIIAQQIGFKNINVDLMLGLPNQTIEDLKQSIEKVIKLEPKHISVYSLILEEDTPLYNMINNNELVLPDEELERKMYWYVKNKLELSGYNHYEISNFSKKGYESKHNINCWNQEEYLGFGLAAHSYFNKKRYSNTENLNEYIENFKNIKVHEIQNVEEQEKEYMLLGLRKIEGISISKFKEKFLENPIYKFNKELSKLNAEGLITVDGDKIKLTNKGLDFANIVWEEFV